MDLVCTMVMAMMGSLMGAMIRPNSKGTTHECKAPNRIRATPLQTPPTRTTEPLCSTFLPDSILGGTERTRDDVQPPPELMKGRLWVTSLEPSHRLAKVIVVGRSPGSPRPSASPRRYGLQSRSRRFGSQRSFCLTTACCSRASRRTRFCQPPVRCLRLHCQSGWWTSGTRTNV